MPNRTKEIKDKSDRNPYLSTSLKYPLDIETEGTRHIILFNINVVEGSKYFEEGNIPNEGPKIQRPGSNGMRSKISIKRNTKRIDTSIALQLPQNLTFNYMTNWNTNNFDGTGKFMNVISKMEWDTEAVMRAIQMGAGNTAAGLLQRFTPIDAKNLLEFNRGAIKNPYKEMMFSGVNNRQFTWQFKMTPRNIEESNQVRKICNAFKTHQMPEINGKYGSGYINYPSEFDITFIKKDGTENEWIDKISTCALSNCEIIYGDEGGYQVHGNDAPVEISLALTFMEMEVLTRNRIIESGY
jgi:hypothetical protein